MTILTLEVVDAGTSGRPIGTRATFRETGGTIGRLPGSDLVLDCEIVSRESALIRYANGVYYLEVISKSHSVRINGGDRRLGCGDSYALQPGDRITIEPFEIHVSIDTQPGAGAVQPRGEIGRPFAPDPAVSGPAMPRPRPTPPDDHVDPLFFLPGPQAPPPGGVVRGAVLGGSELHGAVDPPVVAPSPTPAREPIPPGYDPARPKGDSLLNVAPPGPPPARGIGGAVMDGSQRQANVVEWPSEASPAARIPDGYDPSRPPGESLVRPSPLSPARATPSPARGASAEVPPPVPGSASAREGTLADVFKGLGLENVPITPELAQDLGRILRVVVSGVMEVLDARQEVKSEFRLIERTVFDRRGGNNPLKFSQDVEHALHNLFGRRTAAFLGPVDAFADAFDDIRYHQMALLEGVRKGFEAMLADLNPDQLEERFDRQIKKGALLAAPAKLRYWDLYRDRFHDMVSDAEKGFRDLFGDEFAKTYERQLRHLKEAQRRAEKR